MLAAVAGASVSNFSEQSHRKLVSVQISLNKATESGHRPRRRGMRPVARLGCGDDCPTEASVYRLSQLADSRLSALDHVTGEFSFISRPSSLQPLYPAVEIVFAVLINGSLFQSVSGRRPVVIGVGSATLGMESILVPDPIDG